MLNIFSTHLNQRVVKRVIDIFIKFKIKIRQAITLLDHYRMWGEYFSECTIITASKLDGREINGILDWNYDTKLVVSKSGMCRFVDNAFISRTYARSQQGYQE
ncbi:hypothetical protein HA51_06375 [Pantoea rwandensis]|uniref:Uncharacterized protein n=1 Tax=Pantoea rwandensis TaxID=1076550 RepID=A0A1X1D1C1_9GAMM|nr:hypothetical protein HA51_06375 [Pantoea rwandensis]